MMNVDIIIVSNFTLKQRNDIYILSNINKKIIVRNSVGNCQYPSPLPCQIDVQLRGKDHFFVTPVLKSIYFCSMGSTKMELTLVASAPMLCSGVR
jgi:hypothetical protein